MTGETYIGDGESEDGAYLKGVEDGVAAERERCAKLCDELHERDSRIAVLALETDNRDRAIIAEGAAMAAKEIASMIRNGE